MRRTMRGRAQRDLADCPADRSLCFQIPSATGPERDEACGKKSMSSPGTRTAFRAPAPLRWWTGLASHYRHFEFSAGILLFCPAYYLACHSYTPTSPSPLWIPGSVLLCTLLRAPPRTWWIFLLLI